MKLQSPESWRIPPTYLVENFPSYIGVHDMELMQKAREQIDHLGVTVEEVCEVIDCALIGRRKIVETEDTVYDAGAVIIATDRKPVPLDVLTEYVPRCIIAPCCSQRRQ